MRGHADDICPEPFRCLANRCCRFPTIYYLQLSFDSSQFSFDRDQTMELPFKLIRNCFLAVRHVLDATRVMTSRFHPEQQWRGVADARPSAK